MKSEETVFSSNLIGEVDFMSTVVAQKWGNSLGIRIPKEAAERAGIHQGSRIDLQVGKNGLISLIPRKKDYSLEELVSKITEDNRHLEADWGTEGQELL